ncbi:PilN domain-containing protein [Acetivibrio clariflavus]|uniref:Tfp pilus assembly protein PilN n=1 Tax=Acetivibrio clariflavus (strain DSM 19732 / NBRC 101661 / EBR45) TaxID=720554 RepID=G8M170_ACECE|nr:fimbrial assembly protein [Acetivibrio clariflavus]AEV68046.1 Tfp pilus assembly protein PilN [Acetivibrio clariflavus DSM 19732]
MKDINLLPEDIKSASAYAPGKPDSNAGTVFKVIGVLLFMGIFIIASLVAPKIYIKKLEADLSSIEKYMEDSKFDEVKKVNADIDAIKGVIASKNDVMETVDKNIYPINEVLIIVNNSLPRGTTLNGIDYKNNKIKLTGYTNDILAIAELVAKINRLDSVQIASDITVDQTNKFNLDLVVGGKEGK